MSEPRPELPSASNEIAAVRRYVDAEEDEEPELALIIHGAILGAGFGWFWGCLGWCSPGWGV